MKTVTQRNKMKPQNSLPSLKCLFHYPTARKHAEKHGSLNRSIKPISFANNSFFSASCEGKEGRGGRATVSIRQCNCARLHLCSVGEKVCRIRPKLQQYTSCRYSWRRNEVLAGWKPCLCKACRKEVSYWRFSISCSVSNERKMYMHTHTRTDTHTSTSTHICRERETEREREQILPLLLCGSWNET